MICSEAMAGQATISSKLAISMAHTRVVMAAE